MTDALRPLYKDVLPGFRIEKKLTRTFQLAGCRATPQHVRDAKRQGA